VPIRRDDADLTVTLQPDQASSRSTTLRVSASAAPPSLLPNSDAVFLLS